MKRKIIKQGPSTLMISLPSKWVKSQGIKQGDEVELEVSDNNVVVSLQQKEPITRQASIDIFNFKSKALLFDYLNSLYKSGVDEIEIKFENMDSSILKKMNKTKVIDIIKVIAQNYIGMEIVRAGTNFCILKEVSKTSSQEIETLMNKLLISCVAFAEDIIEYTKSKNFETLYNSYRTLDDYINRLQLYTSRILNKYGHAESYKTVIYYYISQQLENIGDNLSLIAENIGKHKLKMNRDFFEVMKKLIARLNALQEVFSRLEYKKILEIHSLRKEISSKINEFAGKLVEFKVMDAIERCNLEINEITTRLIEMSFLKTTTSKIEAP